MERTPKSKKFSLLRKSKSYECDEVNSVNPGCSKTSIPKTPLQTKPPEEVEYSPAYVPCTQEAFDQLAVVWDWNSPQSKPCRNVPPRRRIPEQHQSPTPIKRHASNNKIESFHKLKHEMEALKSELESCGNNKRINKNLFCHNDDINEELKYMEDIFGDESLEEEMILQSQKIEQLINMPVKNDVCDSISVQKPGSNTKTWASPKLELRKVKSDHQIETFKKMERSNNLCVEVSDNAPKTSVNCLGSPSITHAKSDKEEIKGNSYRIGFVGNGAICNSSEIERKKLMAMAKLEAKKQALSKFTCNKLDIPTHTDQSEKDETSPIKCSPKEIEQKRLQALAKLQAKKKQEQIERNRQEALKRLELSKKRRALNTPNALCNKI